MSNMAELARAIVGGGTSPRSSEHMATVTRKAKDGTYWVHIPGGEDETPISSYLSEASEGDTVRVKISSGKAVMTGNVSSPSATIRSVSVVGSKAEKIVYSPSGTDRVPVPEADRKRRVLNDEAVRVVKSAPKWKPAKMDGSPIRVPFTVRVVFD